MQQWREKGVVALPRVALSQRRAKSVGQYEGQAPLVGTDWTRKGGNHESTQALRRALWPARMVRASRFLPNVDHPSPFRFRCHHSRASGL